MSDAVALWRTIVTLDALYLDIRYKKRGSKRYMSYGCSWGKVWFNLQRQSFNVIPIELATRRDMMM